MVEIEQSFDVFSSQLLLMRGRAEQRALQPALPEPELSPTVQAGHGSFGGKGGLPDPTETLRESATPRWRSTLPVGLSAPPVCRFRAVNSPEAASGFPSQLRGRSLVRLSRLGCKLPTIGAEKFWRDGRGCVGRNGVERTLPAAQCMLTRMIPDVHANLKFPWGRGIWHMTPQPSICPPSPTRTWQNPGRIGTSALSS